MFNTWKMDTDHEMGFKNKVGCNGTAKIDTEIKEDTPQGSPRNKLKNRWPKTRQQVFY